MPRMLGPDKGAKAVEIGGREHRQRRDGTFHVDQHTAKLMRKTGDFVQVGTVISAPVGFRCQDCGFLAVFSDHCGRCDGTNLVPED